MISKSDAVGKLIKNFFINLSFSLNYLSDFQKMKLEPAYNIPMQFVEGI